MKQLTPEQNAEYQRRARLYSTDLGCKTETDVHFGVGFFNDARDYVLECVEANSRPTRRPISPLELHVEYNWEIGPQELSLDTRDKELCIIGKEYRDIDNYPTRKNLSVQLTEKVMRELHEILGILLHKTTEEQTL